MPACFETWTVLDHDPIEKLSDRLWTVSGTFGKTQRRMAVVKLSGDRLLIHNAIALRPESMAELDAWGRVSHLLVPNAFHRQDAKIWQRRYPEARLCCPAGARKKVERLMRVDASFDLDLEDDSVRLFHFRGCREREGAVLLREPSSTSLVVNDVVLNMPSLGGFMGFLLSPTGGPSVPRISRWMLLSDAHAFAEHLRELAASPGLSRVLVGHGATVVDDPAGALERAAARVAS